MLAAAATLAGCGSDSSLIDGASNLPESSVAAPVSPAALKPILRQVSYRPAMGPPDDVNAILTRQLSQSAVDNRIALITDANIAAELVLRGYISASAKGSTINVSYIWDLVDSRGQRQHRISGEEAVSAGGTAAAPWSSFDAAVAKRIADRTMGDLGRWAASQAPPVIATNPTGPVPSPLPPSAAGGGLSVQPRAQ